MNDKIQFQNLQAANDVPSLKDSVGFTHAAKNMSFMPAPLPATSGANFSTGILKLLMLCLCNPDTSSYTFLSTFLIRTI